MINKAIKISKEKRRLCKYIENFNFCVPFIKGTIFPFHTLKAMKGVKV
jgi:hypothetical protein